MNISCTKKSCQYESIKYFGHFVVLLLTIHRIIKYKNINTTFNFIEENGVIGDTNTIENNTSLKFNFDSIKLPSPYSSKNIWLISPKFEFTFSKKTFWTTYIQYSSQSEDLGINSRLQFRFAPLSDLYLVYNDNYYASNSILPRFRSINLKLTYWFNI